MARLPAAPVVITDDYDALVASYLRSLRARNLSAATIECYKIGLRVFGNFLTETGMPRIVANLTREHVETWLIALRDAGRRPQTLATRYRTLVTWFGWLVDEGEITSAPTERMRQPHVPEEPPPILTDAQLAKLLKACAGRDFFARRDLAMIRLLIDTGLRVSELVGIRLEDVDLDEQIVRVMGKGRKPRRVPIGAKTTAAIDRYLRERSRHTAATLDCLWLGPRGKVGDEAVRERLRLRAEQAGIDGRIYPHLLRHVFSHRYLAAGGQENSLKKLAGWGANSPMVARYGSSAAVARAIAEHRRLALGDRL